MSDLLKEIEALPTSSRRPNECKACFLLAPAAFEERRAVDDALDAGTGPSALAAILARNGYDVSGDNLAKHHKKGHRLS